MYLLIVNRRAIVYKIVRRLVINVLLVLIAFQAEMLADYEE